MTDSHRSDPIFIHGILPRSGTNFLWDLLLLHPDCSRPIEPVNEDLFLEHSEHLAAFVAAVRAAWDPRWGTFGADLPDRLYAGIGEGLVSFLHTERNRRLVAKSPSVRHLDRFFTFFPSARLLILVRDGRSVAQSAMDTFGWDFDRVCRAWAEAARTIGRFQRAEAARADQWRVVRYEALFDDPEGQLRPIFEFLELDATRYDFEAARALPVRGSSAFGRRKSAVHWGAVARDESFAPKERWRSWSADRVERFDWLAGDELAALSYAGARRRFPIGRSVGHTVRDWRWHAAGAVRRAVYRARMRVRLRSRLAAALAARRLRGAVIPNERERVSHGSRLRAARFGAQGGAGIAGVPASERAGGAGGAKPPSGGVIPNERERVSHGSGAGIAGVPASERAGGAGGAKPPS
jgi:protein-tyrosine sulfotransferase